LGSLVGKDVSATVVLAHARRLGHATRAALSDLPPACSGVTSNYAQALTDLSTAAHDIIAGHGQAGTPCSASSSGRGRA
jgi:hypothetical protein